MQRLKTVVQYKINEIISNKFDAVFNVWSGEDIRYAGLFATYPAINYLQLLRHLLKCFSTASENTLSAAESYEYM